MSEVVVGVKRVGRDGALAVDGEPAHVAVMCMWVRIGDAYIDEGLVSVEQRCDKDVMTVVIKLTPGDYRTVDYLTDLRTKT